MSANKTKPMRAFITVNHQYSDRRERPEKSAYRFSGIIIHSSMGISFHHPPVSQANAKPPQFFALGKQKGEPKPPFPIFQLEPGQNR
jgi:hypothetical protein